jgi:hypothetical protein
MARCESCDLELDDVERFCPGCGATAPRRVATVTTSLRESFHTATSDDDDQVEYAFGGSKRRVKAAPPPQTKSVQRRNATPRPPPASARTQNASPLGAESVREPVVERHVPAPEVPEPLVESAPAIDLNVSVEAEREEDDELVDVTGAEEDPASSIDEEPSGEPGDTDDEIELEIEVELEDETAIDDEAEIVEEPDVEAPELGCADTEPAIADEEEEEEEPFVASPAVRTRRPVPSEERIAPYVVLPVRRAAAVLELEPEEEQAEAVAPAVRRRGRGLPVVLVMLLLIAGAAAYLVNERSSAERGAPFTAAATDDSISLDAPAGWRIEARSTGVVGIGDPTRDIHVHATAIRRSAVGKGLSLARRANQVQDEFAASLSRAAGDGPQTTTVGPYPAVRRVITAAVAGGDVTYVHTVVKAPKYFVNVLAWAPADLFREQQGVLLGVAGSLQAP